MSPSVITSYSIHYTKLYDQRGEAEAEVARFLREPWHPRYAEASWRTGKADEHIDYGAGSPSLLAQFLLQAGPLTLVVLLLCLLVFALQWLIGPPLLDWLGFFTDWAALSVWQPWRLLTPALLHSYNFV